MERAAEELEMEILERCLRRLEEGADLEACLQEFPEAAALRPMLEAALWIQQGRQATLRPGVLRRMIREGQIRAAALRPSPRPAPRALRWAGLLAVFLGLLLAALGVAGAAEASLPGAPLYPVKRAVEGLLAIAMPSVDRALWLAERRWEEFERAASQGRWLPALAEESLREAEVAARAEEGGGSSPRAARLRALLARQEALLTRASQDAPLEIRPALAQARARWAALARLLHIPEKESSSPPTPAADSASPMPSTPTAEVLRERTRTPPGLEKEKEEKKKEKTPPGLEKRETPPPQRTPPGQGQRPPTRTPPGPQEAGSPPGPSQDKGQDSKNVPPGRR